MSEPIPLPEDLRPIRPGEERRPPSQPASDLSQLPAPASPPRRLEPASEQLKRPPLPG